MPALRSGGCRGTLRSVPGGVPGNFLRGFSRGALGSDAQLLDRLVVGPGGARAGGPPRARVPGAHPLEVRVEGFVQTGLVGGEGAGGLVVAVAEVVAGAGGPEGEPERVVRGRGAVVGRPVEPVRDPMALVAARRQPRVVARRAGLRPAAEHLGLVGGDGGGGGDGHGQDGGQRGSEQRGCGQHECGAWRCGACGAWGCGQAGCGAAAHGSPPGVDGPPPGLPGGGGGITLGEGIPAAAAAGVFSRLHRRNGVRPAVNRYSGRTTLDSGMTSCATSGRASVRPAEGRATGAPPRTLVP